MRILMTGASGLVGSATAGALRGAGHTVDRLARPNHRKESRSDLRPIRWNPATGELDRQGANGADAVVHLAGASISEGRWTSARKKTLRESRVEATRNLVTSLLQLDQRPHVLVAASAVGYYGSRGDEVLTEESAPGDDFLAQLARDWEKEAARAADFGMRTVILRFGMILAPHGGALERMLLPFQLGLGGRLGSGRQWMSWLTLPDAVGLIRHALEDESLKGPVNAVAPNPVVNAEFTRTLGRVLRRPRIFPAPAFALRIAFGEMADALLLSSQRAVPAKLQQMYYRFQYPTLEAGLRLLLVRPA
jgi:uncharacterized protein (TIGR01777 family)